MKIKLVALLITILLICCAICNICSADQNGLAEVNKHRARRGLRPFIQDNNLAIAAQACSKYRARYRIAGHVAINGGDFAFVPRCYRDSYPARAAGCGAWHISTVTTSGDRWGTCCMYDNYTYAGAWSHVGPDGIRYMHLFVR